MENFHQLLSEAKRSFDTADHLAYVTYPMVKEPKLIITIITHINNALQQAMQALLVYEKLYKRISYIPEDFMTRIYILRQSIFPRYNMHDYSKLILELRNILNSHKSSNMEFIRRDKYFIYSNSYSNVASINMNNIKDYLSKTRSFVDNVSLILENGRSPG